MLVKICGTTNLADAQLAVDHGADALGFIFAPSKRRVTAAQAARIAPFSRKPLGVQRVGVFTEPDLKGIEQTVQEAGLNVVQMHWPYNGDRVQQFHITLGPRVALWQVVGFQVQPVDVQRAEATFVDELSSAMRDTNLVAVLLDSVKGQVSGGQGVSFPWRRARDLLDQSTAGLRSRRSLILAGGLRPENIREAIATMQPDGVDAVSGVEKSPGHKDPDRVRAFLRAAKL